LLRRFAPRNDSEGDCLCEPAEGGRGNLVSFGGENKKLSLATNEKRKSFIAKSNPNFLGGGVI
jgi:hypothetical protein